MTITVYTDNEQQVISSQEPMLLSAALQQLGIPFDLPCGGNQSCAKCVVQASGMLSDPMPVETHLKEGQRLACCATALGDCTVRLHQKQAVVLTDGLLPAFTATAREGIGFAVDIGTTTVVMYCYDLTTQTLLDKASFQNPQRVFGADVISRIEAALDGQAAQLQQLIVSDMAQAAKNLCEKHGFTPAQITAYSITGNTTMLYLLTQTDVKPLSAAPFAITELLGQTSSATELGLFGDEHTTLHLVPTISAFVGSDITSAIVSSSLTVGQKRQLLIDIGTNGEMAFYNGSELYCCSTAAGPAFEGAGICYGMPAVAGAIDRVWVADGKVECSTIGGATAIGVCGSGLIDGVSTFVSLGCIDDTGCIDEEVAEELGILAEYDDAEALRFGNTDILLTAQDVRQVQLAKAAICAGVESLLHAANCEPEEVEQVLLAGGFGRFIDIHHAAVIGLIPKVLEGRTKAIGNAAGMGAVLSLLSETSCQEHLEVSKSATTLDLSTSAYFMDSYVANMMFSLGSED